MAEVRRSVEDTNSTSAVGAQQGSPANGPAGGVPSPQPRSHTESAPVLKPSPPTFVRKYGKTVGTAQHSRMLYRGRVMEQEVAMRCYERDLEAWNRNQTDEDVAK